MTMNQKPVPDDEWEAILDLVPSAKKLDQDERRMFKGILRRELILEREAEAEALNVFRADDTAGLTRLIDSLPVNTPEEIELSVDELQLPQDEAEMEEANWAVRHQSIRGDLLVSEQIVPFRLIRLNRYTYLLMTPRGEAKNVLSGFCLAFGRDPDVTSKRALRDEEHRWSSWAWFLDPDRDSARRDAEQLRQLWEGM